MFLVQLNSQSTHTQRLELYEIAKTLGYSRRPRKRRDRLVLRLYPRKFVEVGQLKMIEALNSLAAVAGWNETDQQ